MILIQNMMAIMIHHRPGIFEIDMFSNKALTWNANKYLSRQASFPFGKGGGKVQTTQTVQPIYGQDVL